MAPQIRQWPLLSTLFNSLLINHVTTECYIAWDDDTIIK
jgi:hypothetical protein